MGFAEKALKRLPRERASFQNRSGADSTEPGTRHQGKDALAIPHHFSLLLLGPWRAGKECKAETQNQGQPGLTVECPQEEDKDM